MILSSLRKLPLLQLDRAGAGAVVAEHLSLAFETPRIPEALGPRLVHCSSSANQNQLQIISLIMKLQKNMSRLEALVVMKRKKKKC